ncbi:MAG: ectoine/hydroxyectoine ABC transporter permease subunit EhuC [Pseudomonadota bacterium]
MDNVLNYVPELIEATAITIQLTLAIIIVAFVAALVAGSARLSRWRIVRLVAGIYVEVFRGASALIILFWIYYALPFFGVSLDAYMAAVIGLGLNSGAYGAEIVRGAILAVPKGQYEAATALNFTSLQRLRYVILPQAIVMMMPPFGNKCVEILKATSLVSLITLTDLTARGKQLATITFQPIEVFLIVLVIYFVIASIISFVMRRLEAALARNVGRRVVA